MSGRAEPDRNAPTVWRMPRNKRPYGRQAAPLKQCAFLGFQIGPRGEVVWTAKAHARFKRRVREITRRNRGRRVQDVIDELRRYVTGWLNYFGISHTCNQVVELAEWVRRRVRLYYWKQWKQPRARRRHLLALGIPPDEVRMATRSRTGYWRMSANSIVQRALTNRWLHERGAPDTRKSWIALHYGPNARDRSEPPGADRMPGGVAPVN